MTSVESKFNHLWGDADVRLLLPRVIWILTIVPLELTGNRWSFPGVGIEIIVKLLYNIQVKVALFENDTIFITCYKNINIGTIHFQ